MQNFANGNRELAIMTLRFLSHCASWWTLRICHSDAFFRHAGRLEKSRKLLLQNFVNGRHHERSVMIRPAWRLRKGEIH